MITLCQPDKIKGCCACCGLFNFKDISRESLTEFLQSSAQRINSRCHTDDDYTERCDIRDITSHICNYQGFIGSGRPGCTVHPSINCADLRDKSLFGSKICGVFLCPAHSIIDERRKRILIDYIDDWYYYTLSIIDPDFFIGTTNMIEKKYGIDISNIANKTEIRRMITSSLDILAEHFNNINIPVFHYSVSEYNLNKGRFSISPAVP